MKRKKIPGEVKEREVKRRAVEFDDRLSVADRVENPNAARNIGLPRHLQMDHSGRLRSPVDDRGRRMLGTSARLTRAATGMTRSLLDVRESREFRSLFPRHGIPMARRSAGSMGLVESDAQYIRGTFARDVGWLRALGKTQLATEEWVIDMEADVEVGAVDGRASALAELDRHIRRANIHGTENDVDEGVVEELMDTYETLQAAFVATPTDANHTAALAAQDEHSRAAALLATRWEHEDLPEQEWFPDISD
jgi:hypothetical protein